MSPGQASTANPFREAIEAVQIDESAPTDENSLDQPLGSQLIRLASPKSYPGTLLNKRSKLPQSFPVHLLHRMAADVRRWVQVASTELSGVGSSDPKR